jgi:hypothetical protein
MVISAISAYYMTLAPMDAPKVFISYSHDTQEHKLWTMNFAVRLRNSGVDAILDQWELQPGDDIPHFMERNLASADRVLMICTEPYVHKANSGAGGVGYEKMIVTASLMKSIASNKVIPIVRQSGTRAVPTFLASKYFIDFSGDDVEYSYDELIRNLLGAPLFQKPPISSALFQPVGETPPEPTVDNVRTVMQIMVDLYESSPREYFTYGEIFNRSAISRFLLDYAVKEAEGRTLIAKSGDYYKLTDAGRRYALLHKLIN